MNKKYRAINCEQNLSYKNYIHTSCILYSNLNNMLNISLEEQNRLTNERLSKLSLIKYKNDALDEEDIKELGISSNEEVFSWFVDENGKIIDYNKSIRLFDGVKLISNFLEKRYGMDKNFISEVKISELLEVFEGKGEISVYQLYNHVAHLYNKDEDSFKTKVVENLVSSSDAINIYKPLGKFGDTTLNEIAQSLKDLKWDLVLNNTQITLHSVPMAVNFISYSLMLKSYMKYVHNRPYDSNMNIVERKIQQSIRNRNLVFFSLIGAPLALVLIHKTAIQFKDIGSINLNSPNDSINNNALFLIITNFYKKIPNWLKLFFKLLTIVIIILKLLGFSILDFLINIYYLKLYILYSSSIAIMYQLNNIFLLHKFSNKKHDAEEKVKISDAFPDFLIEWLKEFEVLSTSPESIKEFKNMCYIHICIYVLIILITLLFL